MLDIIKHQRTAASLASAQALSADDITALLTWATRRTLILNALWLTPAIFIAAYILWGISTQPAPLRWLLDIFPWQGFGIILSLVLYHWALPRINYTRNVIASLKPVNNYRKAKLVRWSHWYSTIDDYLARVSLRDRDPLMIEYQTIKRIVHRLKGRA
jgi:energy-coupling factor transporter transmembrane protein EcfT